MDFQSSYELVWDKGRGGERTLNKLISAREKKGGGIGKGSCLCRGTSKKKDRGSELMPPPGEEEKKVGKGEKGKRDTPRFNVKGDLKKRKFISALPFQRGKKGEENESRFVFLFLRGRKGPLSLIYA